MSGGPDSVALLDLLATLAPKLGLALLVAHADHGILDQSAEAARQVESLALRYGLPCEVGRLALGAGTGETRARLARYRFLRRVQSAHAAEYLVTAHHADDQAETVMLRLLRGSAPAGLSGIPAVGPRGLVRPLLPFRRAELLAHAAALGVPLFHDPSNDDPRHLRAWVRGSVLPVLAERLADGGADALLAVARHAQREVRAWDDVLAELPGLDVRAGEGTCSVAREVLTGYHNVLAERVLRAAARRAGLRLPPRAAARAVKFAARAPSGRRLDLPGGLVAEVAFERLSVGRSRVAPTQLRIQSNEGEARYGAWSVQWRTEPAPARAALARQGWVTWVEPTPGELVVGPPKPGDRLVPVGGTGRRRVARLLMEARVPRMDRGAYPVIAANGDVLWVPGVCRSGARLPAPGTPAVRIEVGRR